MNIISQKTEEKVSKLNSYFEKEISLCRQRSQKLLTEQIKLDTAFQCNSSEAHGEASRFVSARCPAQTHYIQITARKWRKL